MTSSSFFLNTYMCTCYYIIYRISPKRRHQTKGLNHPLASGTQGCGIVARIRQPVSFYFIFLLSLLVCGARIFISLLVHCIWTESTFCYRYQVVVVCQIKSTACIFHFNFLCSSFIHLNITWAFPYKYSIIVEFRDLLLICVNQEGNCISVLTYELLMF